MFSAFIVRHCNWKNTTHGLTGLSDTRWSLSVAVIAFLIPLIIGSLNLASENADRLEIVGDSAKYHALATTVELFLQHPSLAKKLFQDDLTPQEREDVYIDRWEFQHAPAYVLTLGLLYSLLPNDEGVGRSLSIIFHALSAMLVLLIGRVLLGRLWAWLPYLGFLLYLPFLYYATAIATEIFSCFMLLLCSYLLIGLHKRITKKRIILAGLGLAALFLAKTTFRPLAIALILGEAFYLIYLRRFVSVRYLLICALTPLALWYLFLSAAAIPIDPLSKSGDTQLWLYRGNYVPDQGWETVGIGDAVTPELKAGGTQAIAKYGSDAPEEIQRRTMYKNALIETIKNYPAEWLALVLKKFGLFWKYPARKWYINSVIGSWPIPLLVHQVIYLLALLGLSLSFRRSASFWLPAVLLLAVSAVHCFSHLVARYNIPVFPLWGLYACFGLRSIHVTIMHLWRKGDFSWLRKINPMWPIAALVCLATGQMLKAMPFSNAASSGRFCYLTGSILCGVAFLSLGPLLILMARKVNPGRTRRLWVLLGGPVILALVVIGDAVSERDWDQISRKLDQPGEAVIQRISYSGQLAESHGGLKSAQIYLDLLRSPRGGFTLDLFVNGKLHHTFVDSLAGSFQTFEFDKDYYADQDRFQRVANTYQNYVEKYLNRRHGQNSLGYDYFRRWVCLELPREMLISGIVEIELRLRDVRGGGWVKVYGDRFCTDNKEHIFNGPSLDENLFEYSSYRAEFYGGNRERMDARLIRRKMLQSPWAVSLYRSGEDASNDLLSLPGEQMGQWRIRIKTLIHGRMVLRQTETGTWKRLWTNAKLDTDQPLDQKQLRNFQGWRDLYFDGTWVY